MALRTCANCEREIGHLEPDLRWQEHPVCRACYERLSRPIGVPTVSKRPGKPWVFWLAIALFTVGAALVTVDTAQQAMQQANSLMGGGPAAMRRLNELESSTGSGGGSVTTGLLSVVLLIAHVVGFLAAWRGLAWGAFVMTGTAVILGVMEFSGGSMIGITLTPLSTAGVAIGYLGFVCFFLPSAWQYYRRSAQYRRGEPFDEPVGTVV